MNLMQHGVRGRELGARRVRRITIASAALASVAAAAAAAALTQPARSGSAVVSGPTAASEGTSPDVPAAVASTSHHSRRHDGASSRQNLRQPSQAPTDGHAGGRRSHAVSGAS